MTAPDLAELKSGTDLRRLVAETMQLRRAGKLLTGCCPFHAEKTPSFVVYTTHFHCYACGAHGDHVDWLTKQRGMTFAEARRHLGGDPQPGASRPPPPPPPAPPRDDAEAARNRDLGRRMWTESAPAVDTLAEVYLRGRGLALPHSAALRFHPACPRGDGPPMPAMLGLMTRPETNEPCGVHRTFLAADGRGKAPIERPKRMLGNAGVIRLVPDEEVTLGLGICEGIETGLAVMQHFGFSPVWAACSAGGIAKFPVLGGIEAIRIFADMDDNGAGIEAARACASTWAAAGREAVIKKPAIGSDWLDVAAEYRKGAA